MSCLPRLRICSRRERAAFLDSACAGDAGLRAEIESLLEHDTEELPVGDAVGAAALSMHSSHLVGRRIGPYRIVSLIGHGGMASVYLAERADGEF